MSSAVQSRKIALPRALAHGAKREKSGVPRAKLVYHGTVARRLHRTLWYSAWEGAAAAVQHNAHNLRTPKHGSRYRYGRRRGRFVLRFLFNTTRARARMVRTPKQKHERAHQMRGGAEVRPEFQLRPRRRARFWQQFPIPTLVAHGPSTCQMSSPYSRKRAPACARCALCSSRTVHSLTIPRLLPSTVRNASVYRVITQAS